MSKSKTANAPTGVSRLHAMIHDIEPLLKETGPFVLAETDLDTENGTHEVKGMVAKCEQVGALDQIERVRYRGKTRWKYEWVEGAREYLVNYLADLDKLPCGCRSHIPDSRDDPDGKISCNHCGRMYDEDRFKELVL